MGEGLAGVQSPNNVRCMLCINHQPPPSLPYLHRGCFYGTSSSVYGPYTYVGSAIDTNALAPAFRTNQTNGPWYSHEDYADRHGSFWHNNAGQWFYASNDRSHSTDRQRSYFRDTVVGYVHYASNFSILPVAIDETGVGEYRASHIEAENFMRLSGDARKVHLPARGDAVVVAVHSAAATALSYPHVVGAGTVLSCVAANAGAAPVTVTARRGTAAGAAFARCIIAPSGSAFVRTSCPAALRHSDALALDVVLTFEGEAGEGQLQLQLDSWALA